MKLLKMEDQDGSFLYIFLKTYCKARHMVIEVFLGPLCLHAGRARIALNNLVAKIGGKINLSDFDGYN